MNLEEYCNKVPESFLITIKVRKDFKPGHGSVYYVFKCIKHVEESYRWSHISTSECIPIGLEETKPLGSPYFADVKECLQFANDTYDSLVEEHKNELDKYTIHLDINLSLRTIDHLPVWIQKEIPKIKNSDDTIELIHKIFEKYKLTN